MSNERVLEMCDMKRSMMVTIWRRQLRFVGHAVRKEGLQKLVLEKKLEGKEGAEEEGWTTWGDRRRQRDTVRWNFCGVRVTGLVSEKW